MDEPAPTKKEQEEGIGPMAGAVIIVILVAAAGIYFLLQQQARLHTPPVDQTLNT